MLSITDHHLPIAKAAASVLFITGGTPHHCHPVIWQMGKKNNQIMNLWHLMVILLMLCIRIKVSIVSELCMLYLNEQLNYFT